MIDQGATAKNTPRTRRTSPEKSKTPGLNLANPGVFGLFFSLSIFLLFCILFLNSTPIYKVLRIHSQTILITGIETEQETELKTGEPLKNTVFPDENGGAYVRSGSAEVKQKVKDGGAYGGPVSLEEEVKEKVGYMVAPAAEVKEKVGYLEEGGGAYGGLVALAEDVKERVVHLEEGGGGPVAPAAEVKEKVGYLEEGGGAYGGPVAPAAEVEEKVGYLEEGGGACNIFEGDWTWDESYPLYESRDCPFADDGFRCSENGRSDRNYTKWRWQPKGCNLPRFDARLMLKKLRNKRVAFIGDSIGRNQWESLLCMLSSVVPNKSSIYEVNGNPITKHMGYLIFKFKDFNCTVEYYRAPFLVVQGRPPAKSPAAVRMTLKLDYMAWTSSQWKNADILVFNAGHWWNNGKTIRGGCYFEQKGKVNMNMTVEGAFEKAIETLVNWIDREVNVNKSLVFLRSYAPVHYRGGDWNNGGGCHLERLPEPNGMAYSPSLEARMTTDVFMELVEKKGQRLKESVRVLNVSEISARRKDGHSSIYLSKVLSPLNRQDCSHWCLPGVPDTWNELLYSVLLRKELDSGKKRTQTLTIKY